MAWAPDYVDTASLRSFLRISDGDDDAFLALAITAASRAVDQDTNRQFGQVSPAEERRYTSEWDRRRRRWLVPIDDLGDVTGAVFQVVDEAGDPVGTIDSYTLEPINAVARGRPYELLVVSPDSATLPTGCHRHDVAGTALWGWDGDYPAVVVQATQLQASRIVARRGSPFGIAGSPDVGSELRLLDRVDPDVAVMLRSVRRWWAVA